MKLAILTSHPIPYQVPLYQLLTKERDIDVCVYYCSDDTIRGEIDERFSIQVKWDIPILDGYQYCFIKNYSKKSLYSFFGLINPGIIFELVRNRYDAIIIHGWGSFTNCLVLLFCILFRRPFFLRAESSLFFDSFNKRKLILLGKALLFPLLFRCATGVLSIGSRNTKFYQKYGVSADRIFHCPYAVDNDRFFEAASIARNKREVIRKELGISPVSTVFLFLAKLIHLKRPFDLLYAYESIVLKYDISLLFVGEGYLRKDLTRYVNAKRIKGVHFLGFRNQMEIPSLYAISDVFVNPMAPTKGDWGLTINEALACGLPVIASSALGAPEDLIRSGVNGYIFNHSCVDELIQCMRNCCELGEKRIGFKKASLDIISTWSYREDVVGIREALSILHK